MNITTFLIVFFLTLGIEHPDAVQKGLGLNPIVPQTQSTESAVVQEGEAIASILDVSKLYKQIQKGADPSNLWVLANKENPLPKNFAPLKIVKATVKQKYGNTTVPKVTNEALKAMFDAALKDNVELVLSSGYRNYGFQASLYQQQVNKVGAKEANRWVAKPGESEHQTGLAVDITSSEVDLKLTQDFEKTEAFEWLNEHAADFGFILRYPSGKEEETGYSYEPWHYRYVGDPKAARYIQESSITLEAFMKAVKDEANPQ